MYSAPRYQKPPPESETTTSGWQISRPQSGEDLVWIENEVEERESGAEDEEEKAEAGGGGDVVVEVVHQAHVQRKRPIREVWIVQNNALCVKQ